MNMLLSRLILLSLMRVVCLWLLPGSALVQCADSGLRLLTLMTLMDGARTCWEGWGW